MKILIQYKSEEHIWEIRLWQVAGYVSMFSEKHIWQTQQAMEKKYAFFLRFQQFKYQGTYIVPSR